MHNYTQDNYSNLHCAHARRGLIIVYLIIMYLIAGNVGGELKFALCGFDRDPQTFKQANISSANR